jgi:hypothetical protein
VANDDANHADGILIIRRGARMFEVNENNDLAAGDNAGGGR